MPSLPGADSRICGKTVVSRKAHAKQERSAPEWLLSGYPNPCNFPFWEFEVDTKASRESIFYTGKEEAKDRRY